MDTAEENRVIAARFVQRFCVSSGVVIVNAALLASEIQVELARAQERAQAGSSGADSSSGGSRPVPEQIVREIREEVIDWAAEQMQRGERETPQLVRGMYQRFGLMVGDQPDPWRDRIGPWRDRQGDVWELGADGFLHTKETQPFSWEHVEKKWGPLVRVDQGPWCDSCGGPFPRDSWPGSQYGGHWDTCPNRVDAGCLEHTPGSDGRCVNCGKYRNQHQRPVSEGGGTVATPTTAPTEGPR